jgi:hypothetical protein
MRMSVWAATSALGVTLGFLAAPSSAAPITGSGAGGAKAAISESSALNLVRDGHGGGRGGRHGGGHGGGRMSAHGGHGHWYGGGYRYRRPHYQSYSYGPRYYTSSCWYDADGFRICPRATYDSTYYYRGRGYRGHGYVSRGGGHRPGGHHPGGGGHRPSGGHRR